MKKILFALLWVLPSFAFAGVHLIKLVEVFPGSPQNPNAQYVVIQMYNGGQTFTNSTSVQIFNAAGTSVGTFSFAANLGNGAVQAKALIATTEAATLFGVTANATMNAVIPLTGGKLCFSGSNDCVTWGNFTGAGPVGTPFNPNFGLVQGQAIKRNLGGNGTLEAGDDTNNSIADFAFGAPTPVNNANQAGTVPGFTCGNNTLESVEGCDDGNTTAGDGCNAVCNLEFCGDSIDNNGNLEQCDDGNAVNGDACQNNCTPPAAVGCGNGVIDAGETCDDSNTNNNDGCSSNCLDEVCGDGITQTNEVCDDGNTVSNDGCSGNCQVAEVCGNGIVDNIALELCDDGNQVNTDSCLNNCETFSCGDGFLADLNGNGVFDPLDGDEECDDGNEVDGDGCSIGCTDEVCGDFTVQAPEECDDGNATDGDGCDANCTTTACGNGVQTAGEECDDGNNADGDGCEADCTLPEEDVCEGGFLKCGCSVNPTGEAPPIAFALFALFGLVLAARRRFSR